LPVKVLSLVKDAYNVLAVVSSIPADIWIELSEKVILSDKIILSVVKPFETFAPSGNDW
jgi:hypothetical protein